MERKRENVSTAKLMAWVQSHINLEERKVQKAMDLKDGVAFLLIIAKHFPRLIQKNKIIINPETYEIEHNLRLLKATLKKFEDSQLISLAEEIGNITKSNETEPIINFARRLYSMFSGQDIMIEHLEHKISHWKSPHKLTRQALIKEEKSQVTDLDISKLHSHLRSTVPPILSSSRLQNDEKASKSQNFERVTKINMNDQPLIPFILVDSQLASAILRQKQKPPTAYERCYLHGKLISITISYLKQNEFISGPDISQKFRNSRAFLFQLIYMQMCFTFQQKKYLQSYRKKCINKVVNSLFKSTTLIKMSLLFGRKTSSTIILLKHLTKVQTLPSQPLQFKRIFGLRPFKSKKLYQRYCNVIEQQKTKQFKKPFWTEHLAILIALELRYITKGKNVNESQTDAKSNNQKNGVFSYFEKLSRKLGEQSNKDKTIIVQDHYKNIKNLFDKKFDKQHKSHQSCEALRKHVSVMLNLKHKSVQEIFVKLYDSIIGEIINVKITDIQHSEGRFRIIDGIVGKVRESGREIEEFLMKNYRLEMGEGETEKLLKATVYCFLAELNGFPVNEFYCEAFNVAPQDKDHPPEQQYQQQQEQTRLQ